MTTIDQQSFERLCREVRHETAGTLQTTEPSEKTHLLLMALLKKLCQYLELDFDRQTAELGDRDGFALLQTLEESMEPEFLYSASIDRYLLSQV